MYDSLLYLCTLLGNIAESSPDRKSAIATLVISNLNSEAGSEQSLVEYLAQLVQTEAAPFLNDLRETDGVLRQSTATSAAVTEVTPDSKVGDILNPASSSIVLTSPGHANRVDATGHSSNEKLPVSEIILASHASLLLFSLTHDWLAEETENMVTGPVADSKVALQQKATACLPDGNWWLPLRVLKASLSLQSQVILSIYIISICI